MPIWEVQCPTCRASFHYTHVRTSGRYTNPKNMIVTCHESLARMDDGEAGFSDPALCPAMRRAFEETTGMPFPEEKADDSPLTL